MKWRRSIFFGFLWHTTFAPTPPNEYHHKLQKRRRKRHKKARKQSICSKMQKSRCKYYCGQDKCSYQNNELCIGSAHCEHYCEKNHDTMAKGAERTAPRNSNNKHQDKLKAITDNPPDKKSTGTINNCKNCYYYNGRAKKGRCNILGKCRSGFCCHYKVIFPRSTPENNECQVISFDPNWCTRTEQSLLDDRTQKRCTYIPSIPEYMLNLEPDEGALVCIRIKTIYILKLTSSHGEWALLKQDAQGHFCTDVYFNTITQLLDALFPLESENVK